MVELTLVTVGAVESTTNALLAPSEPALPGVERVSVAAFPAVSAIVPPLSVRLEANT